MAAAVVVTGATGLVGSRLVPALLDDGAPVRAVTRHPGRASGRIDPRAERVAWDGQALASEALAGTRAVVHLAGEPIFSGPLTAARRRRVRESRVAPTSRLVRALAALPAEARPGVLVCASAVGIYGSRGDEELNEEAPPGEGFLARLCCDWEAEAAAASDCGVRVVSLRIGVVLAREGGALRPLATVFRLGLGAQLGDGRQWFPWIHVADLVGLIQHSLRDEQLSGPVNAVAPEPVRNAELTRKLARRLGRRALLRVPGMALQLALGELSGELLGSRRVVPKKAQDRGFAFRYPDLDSALSAEL